MREQKQKSRLFCSNPSGGAPAYLPDYGSLHLAVTQDLWAAKFYVSKDTGVKA